MKYDVSTTRGKPIREWREEERPREKLASKGPSALTDAELIAILLSSGSVGVSALDLARAALDKHKDLSGMARCDYGEFKRFKGIGDARAITLAAAFEIAKRVKAEPFDPKKAISSPEDVAKTYIPLLYGARKEQFRVLLLNSSNAVFREEIVSEGSLNASIVEPREVFRLAVVESAASIILLHNHPSGNKRPSREDIEITKRLVQAGEIINIKILDHLIIAGDDFLSMAGEGLL